MTLPWFRLYSEFATDPVIQSLAFEDQRHFLMLLCFKCSGLLDREFPNPQMRQEVIRKAIGLDGKAWDEMRNRLQSVGIIDADLQPKNWDKRQFISDASTERVRAYRERMNKVKRSGNVSVTAQETDTDTDTEKKERSKQRGSRFALTAPPPEWTDFCKANRPDLNPSTTFAKFRDYWTAVPGARGVKLDWFATWRNFCRTERAPLPNVPQQQEWHKTASGVKAKGAELGLVPELFCLPDGRQDWQAFRAAVYNAAGVHA